MKIVRAERLVSKPYESRTRFSIALPLAADRDIVPTLCLERTHFSGTTFGLRPIFFFSSSDS